MVPSIPQTKPNFRVILLGLAWLSLGAMVYLWDRPVKGFFWGTFGGNLFMDGGSGFGVLGHWLPTFAHVMAWSLITAGALAVRSRTALAAICFLWMGINWGFELGQKNAVSVCEMLPDWPPLAPLMDLLRGYFKNGTFDTGDLWAAGLGAVMALTMLILCTGRKATWSVKLKAFSTP